MPAKWAGYLAAAAEVGDITAYRHYWELCVLIGLRDGLRSGDVYVPGSRRYADPASFLLTPEAWEPQRVEFCALVGKPLAAADALAVADDELHTILSVEGSANDKIIAIANRCTRSLNPALRSLPAPCGLPSSHRLEVLCRSAACIT